MITTIIHLFGYLQFRRNKIISRILSNKVRGMLHKLSQEVVTGSITGP